MPRLIDRHVQLITQANDCCLLTFSEMKTHFERAWDLMEFTQETERPLYIHPNGTSFANESPWIEFYSKWNTPLYRQKVRLLNIHRKGYLVNNPYTFYSKNKDLYLRFINIADRVELAQFIVDTKDFCVFPNEQERVVLAQRYRNALGVEVREFLFSFTKEKLNRKTMEDIAVLNKIHLDFIWEKKEWLKELVTSYRNKTMNLRQLLAVNRNMGQISEVLIDYEDFFMTRAQKSVAEEPCPDERTFNDIIGEKKVAETSALIPVYRVYGHFSLCCLELFLAIQKETSFDQCTSCREFYEKSHGNQCFCSEQCKKEDSAKRSKNYRKRQRLKEK
jgi:hypothetical protein